MPNPALFVPIQPGSGSLLLKPAPRGTAEAGGGRAPGAVWAKRWLLRVGTSTPMWSLPQWGSGLLYFPPLAVCRRPETLVSSDCNGCVSEADRMPVSQEGRWGKQDASIMLAQLGSRPPGDVKRCTASPGRRHRHLEDYIPTLKYTPTKQPSQTSNLALWPSYNYITAITWILHFYYCYVILSTRKKYAYLHQ